MTEEEKIIAAGVLALVRKAGRDENEAGWNTDLLTGEPRPINVPEKLALVHSEVSEALEADRKNLRSDKIDAPGVAEELADAQIRISALAYQLNLDLSRAVVAKLAYNKQRADHKKEARLASNGKAY